MDSVDRSNNIKTEKLVIVFIVESAYCSDRHLIFQKKDKKKFMVRN